MKCHDWDSSLAERIDTTSLPARLWLHIARWRHLHRGVNFWIVGGSGDISMCTSVWTHGADSGVFTSNGRYSPKNCCEASLTFCPGWGCRNTDAGTNENCRTDRSKINSLSNQCHCLIISSLCSASFHPACLIFYSLCSQLLELLLSSLMRECGPQSAATCVGGKQIPTKTGGWTAGGEQRSRVERREYERKIQNQWKKRSEREGGRWMRKRETATGNKQQGYCSIKGKSHELCDPSSSFLFDTQADTHKHTHTVSDRCARSHWKTFLDFIIGDVFEVSWEEEAQKDACVCLILIL